MTKEKKENAYELVTYEKKMSKRMLLILIISSVIVIGLAVLSTIFSLLNLNSDEIITGVKIEGIDVSHLTREQAREKLEKELNSKLNFTLKYQLEEFETIVAPEQIEAKYDIEKTVNDAYMEGRDSNILVNNYTILFRKFSKIDKKASLLYNEELLNTLIENIKTQIPNPVQQVSYSMDEKNLTIIKGKQGNVVKEEELRNSIIQNIDKRTEGEFPIPIEVGDPEPIDIEKIHTEIYKEPKNASFSESDSQVIPHVNGVDFAISLEEAKALLQEEKESYEIPLKITIPEITTNKLGSKAFPYLLASFSTNYITSKVNRTTNLRIASNQINGTVLMPGEVFSYNKVVGPRTYARGFRDAGVYEAGREVTGIGGGICQISSTLYNIAVMANLEIVQRSSHQFVPGYVGPGRDATVVYGALDFKFKNTRKHAIKIVSSVGGGVVTMKIYGTREPVEYDVSFETTVLSRTPYKTIYEDTTSLAPGKTSVSQYGEDGRTSKTYKVLKQNGKVISRTLLSSDRYDTKNKIILRGVSKTPAPTPTPTPTPEPTPTPTPTPEPKPDSNTSGGNTGSTGSAGTNTLTNNI